MFDENGEQDGRPALLVFWKLLGPLLTHHATLARVPSAGDVVTKVVEEKLCGMEGVKLKTEIEFFLQGRGHGGIFNKFSTT